ncbi:MAG: hypothetical protein OIF51_06345 [Cellvibrionaceae bacterium]|nr:hypothetical protein [Cellvibrionaceae bacterium]
MKVLNSSECSRVNGGLTLDQGTALIGGLVLVASVVAAPAAVAFGGGVLAAIAIGRAFSSH